MSSRSEPIPQRLARSLISLFGWHVEGHLPRQLDKFVLVVAPHTSNWDFVIGLPCGFALGLMTTWPYGVMAKASAFRGPMGPVMRGLGCLPVDRSAAHNLVEQMVQVLRERERLMLVITPEGTRQRRPYWKSGFYHIALQANIPVVLGTIDYGRRVACISEPLTLSGQMEPDLAAMRNFFTGVVAKNPRNVSDICFKDA